MITISINTGTGEGPHLLEAGVANYNIIPPSWIQRGRYEPPTDAGDHLYWIMARRHPRSMRWQSRHNKSRAGMEGRRP